MKVYSVYDAKANRFAPPFFVVNDEVAKRTLAHTFVHVGDCPLTQYPGDFSLFGLGEFDEDTGIISCYDSLVNLGTVLQVMAGFKVEVKESEVKESEDE